MSRSYFVTGTDTGIGKTWVSCAVLRQAAASGWRAVGMKPVASGAVWQDGAWVNEDVAALTAAGNVSVAQPHRNPYCFPEPISPHLAAARVGVQVELGPIVRGLQALQAEADLVLVEGAGGLLSPLAMDLSNAQLAQALNLPVLVVVGIRLGCINHMRLTLASLEQHGLSTAGWVANGVDPHEAHAQETIDFLRAHTTLPYLGYLPFASSPSQHGAQQPDLEIQSLLESR